MKKISCTLLAGAMAAAALIGCAKVPDVASSGNTSLIFNKVAYPIFYVPQYTVVELGHFKDEGIGPTLASGAGADKVMTALISGGTQIGFMGSEANVYVYQEDSQDYTVNSAQLTQRAGNFLVGRQPKGSFKWENLKGKKTLGGRVGSVSQMVFEYIPKKHGPDLKTDLETDQSTNFGLTAAAFTSNDAGYTAEPGLLAITLESEGGETVVASLGTESSYVPYTAYCTKKSYMEKNPELVQEFTNTTQKGMDYANSHFTGEIAKAIVPQPKETLADKIATIVERCRDQDTWKDDTISERESFGLLENIPEETDELSKRVPYGKFVIMQFSEAAIK